MDALGSCATYLAKINKTDISLDETHVDAPTLLCTPQVFSASNPGQSMLALAYRRGYPAKNLGVLAVGAGILVWISSIFCHTSVPNCPPNAHSLASVAAGRHLASFWTVSARHYFPRYGVRHYIITPHNTCILQHAEFVLLLKQATFEARITNGLANLVANASTVALQVRDPRAIVVPIQPVRNLVDGRYEIEVDWPVLLPFSIPFFEPLDLQLEVNLVFADLPPSNVTCLWDACRPWDVALTTGHVEQNHYRSPLVDVELGVTPRIKSRYGEGYFLPTSLPS